MAGFLDELRWRGLLNAATDGAEQAFAAAERSAGPGRAPLVGYIGFDPTADSLHIGSLLPVMLLVHLGRQGHRPIALIGGGTGLIGDPSGKSTERVLADRDTVQENAERIGAQLQKFDLETANNIEWLDTLRAIDLLRDTGKHFTVNYMLQKDSVKSRMDAGISFTEFSYMLLQAYDFLQLHKRYNVNLQMGGSDQWGNITAGIELIRRTEGAEAFGVTAPLVTTASGTKFGKTEAGAVWLDPAKTSPYQFYQFWINIEDRDVGKYLRYFTLIKHEEIELLEAMVVAEPEKRMAQRQLALEVTARVHSRQAADTAREMSAVLFRREDPFQMSIKAAQALEREIPFAVAQGSPNLLDLLVELQLTASKGEARRLVQQGGVSANGIKVTPEALLANLPMIQDQYYLIKKGGRDYGLVRVAT